MSLSIESPAPGPRQIISGRKQRHCCHCGRKPISSRSAGERSERGAREREGNARNFNEKTWTICYARIAHWYSHRIDYFLLRSSSSVSGCTLQLRLPPCILRLSAMKIVARRKWSVYCSAGRPAVRAIGRRRGEYQCETEKFVVAIRTQCGNRKTKMQSKRIARQTAQWTVRGRPKRRRKNQKVNGKQCARRRRACKQEHENVTRQQQSVTCWIHIRWTVSDSVRFCPIDCQWQLRYAWFYRDAQKIHLLHSTTTVCLSHEDKKWSAQKVKRIN